MLTLAFDTSTLQGRFALAEDGEILVYQPFNVGGSYADALLKVVDGMLADSGRKKSELKRIAITVGPGSFTGVRIGVSTAKAMAWATGAELYAVSSLEAMAADMLATHQHRDWAMPVLDARRKEVFAGIFKRNGTWVTVVCEQKASGYDNWWKLFLETVDNPLDPVIAGNGALLLTGEGENLRPELLTGKPELHNWNSAQPATARALAIAVSMKKPPFEPVHPFTLVPLYLRASDAEVKKGLDLTPKAPEQS
ncbi:tRNA (adenosine(37)-N6)-threonylcarbamoyltransferase complex dimerization subunit type 1 TsaB [bacterium]|jgi:tRNA threonylcarbamoyladenosine biosynthesis protein TsaB|nr:tRNA (adenosine(37)-N6)-threonylcarbamoyltransferase complex dimerization subunit type 1 TsaB [bacterium]MBT7310260.1 tRNA (adenosine(37)-N6)-threonylcarbamoyltransferase complex dimerization subunit type 1 TsaB [bacterium]